MYRTILLPTDGSAGSEAAIAHAVDLADRYGASLRTMYAVDPSAIPPDVGVPNVVGELEGAGREAIERVVERASAAGVQADGDVVKGAPHRAILEYADEHDADLIVMGTHGRTGLDRVLLGSVTERVVRTADVPVLTVRLAASESESESETESGSATETDPESESES